MGTWDVESTREQFLEVVGRNEILILRVLTNETGDVGTKRNHPEIIDAGEIERYAGEFCRHALAFEWLRHLFDDAIASRTVHVDPRASVDVEDFAEALHAVGGVNADAGFPNDGDFAVGVGLFGFAHEDLQVTEKVYQGIWKNYGVEESR